MSIINKITILDRHRELIDEKGNELIENKGTRAVFTDDVFKESVEFIDRFSVNNKISANYHDFRLSFNLLSGKIENLEPGSYILATGCGSGKTTAILDMMVKYFNQGIFYCAGTIDECDQLYNKLKEFGLDKLTLVIHSKIFGNNDPQYKLSAEIWNNRPDDIANFPIIITTHHKLNSTPPSIFMRYNTNKSDSKDNFPNKLQYRRKFSELLVGITERNVVVRKFILIDEQTEKLGMSIAANKAGIVSLLSPLISNINSEEDLDKVRLFVEYEDIVKSYLRISKYFPNNVPYNKKNPLNEAINLSICEEIANNITKYLNSLGKVADKVPINIKYSDIQQLIMNNEKNNNFVPYFIVFDGVGDYTYHKTSSANIIVSRNYNGKVNFVKVNELSIDRRNENKDSCKDLKNEVNSKSKVIADLCKKGNKTLIVVPKSIERIQYCPEELESLILDYNPEDKEFTIHNSIANKVQLKYSSLNSKVVVKSDDIYPDFYYREQYTDVYNVVVTYYQSPVTRGSNLFRDFDQVILVGNIDYGKKITGEINKFNDSKANAQDYEIQMLHQLISRTRIRNYDGKDVTVYYSDDYNNSLITELKMTFNTDKPKSEIARIINTRKIHTPGFDEIPLDNKIYRLNKYFNNQLNVHEMKYEENGTLDILELPISIGELTSVIPELKASKIFHRDFGRLNNRLEVNHRCKLILK